MVVWPLTSPEVTLLFMKAICVTPKWFSHLKQVIFPTAMVRDLFIGSQFAASTMLLPSHICHLFRLHCNTQREKDRPMHNLPHLPSHTAMPPISTQVPKNSNEEPHNNRKLSCSSSWLKIVKMGSIHKWRKKWDYLSNFQTVDSLGFFMTIVPCLGPTKSWSFKSVAFSQNFWIFLTWTTWTKT